MSESQMWKTLSDGLRGRWSDAVRLEDRLNKGVPDVIYARPGGRGWAWLELKYSAQWPKRPSSVVQLKHFSTEQRRFLTDRPNTWLLWQIGREWLLFDQFDQIGHCTRDALYLECFFSWKSLPEWDELWRFLAYHPENRGDSLY